MATLLYIIHVYRQTDALFLCLLESSKPAKRALRVKCVRSSPYAAMLAAQDVAARCKELQFMGFLRPETY